MTARHIQIDEDGEPEPTAAALQTAEYIGELLKELETLASANRLDRLSALIGLAADEARKLAPG